MRRRGKEKEGKDDSRVMVAQPIGGNAASSEVIGSGATKAKEERCRIETVTRGMKNIVGPEKYKVTAVL